MAEINVEADPSLGPQPFDGGVHDDGIRDQVQAEDLIRLLICLTALLNWVLTEASQLSL